MAESKNSSKLARGEPYTHELGSLLNFVTLFYALTNLYYFPYFTWCSASFPAWLRIMAIMGFLYGFDDHIWEYNGYLKGVFIPFGPGANPFLSIKLQMIAGPFAALTSLMGVGMITYEYQRLSPDNAVLLFVGWLTMSSYSALSTGRGGLYPCSFRYHLEHVFVHLVLTLWMIALGAQFMAWPSSRFQTEFLLVFVFGMSLQVANVYLDNKRNDYSPLKDM